MGHKYVKEEDTFSTSANGTVPKPTAQEVSDHKFLRSDGTWQSGGGGGGGASELNDLSDVDLENVADGDMLIYSSLLSAFTNKKYKTQSSVKTPSDAKSGSRLMSFFIGSAGSSTATFTVFSYGDYQDISGLIVHRAGVDAVAYGSDTGGAVPNRYSSRLTGNQSVSVLVDTTARTISFTLPNWDSAYFIGFTSMTYIGNQS